MSKLFVKNRIVPKYILDDILYDLNTIPETISEVAYITESKNTFNFKKNSLDVSFRNSNSKILNAYNYLDLAKIFENYCKELDPENIPSLYKMRELEYLKYGISGHFKKHTDAVQEKDARRIRRFSLVTLLSKNHDLEGGDLIIYDENNNEINTKLEVGETIIFHSKTFHKVTPITKGGREVLFAALFYR